MKAVIAVELRTPEKMGAEEEAVTNSRDMPSAKPIPVMVTGVVGDPAGAELGVTPVRTG
jgi:hypothetical protein